MKVDLSYEKTSAQGDPVSSNRTLSKVSYVRHLGEGVFEVRSKAYKKGDPDKIAVFAEVTSVEMDLEPDMPTNKGERSYPIPCPTNPGTWLGEPYTEPEKSSGKKPAAAGAK